VSPESHGVRGAHRQRNRACGAMATRCTFQRSFMLIGGAAPGRCLKEGIAFMEKPKTRVILCTVRDDHSGEPVFKKDVRGPGGCTVFSSHRIVRQALTAMFRGHDVIRIEGSGKSEAIATLLARAEASQQR
jgi:hypothetical protein